jgi:hypothetical protein
MQLSATTTHALSAKHPKADAPQTSSAATGTDFSYNAQDAVVMSPETIKLNVTAGPASDQVKLSKTIKPENGAYVFDNKDPRYHAAVAFSAAEKTVETFEKALGDNVKWAFGGKQLGVKADAGTDFNAYYSRQSGDLNFFHDTDPKTKQVLFSADSGEVVSHETGHAILDAMRPGYLSSWSPDPAAFHESFGDVMGMLMTLQDDASVKQLAQQTGGDLSKPNLLAATGEQLGIGINDSVGKNVTGGDYVRNAINDFTWQDPSTLPDRGDATHLGSEAHSFSRLWTGAFYDVLTEMTNQHMKAGMSAEQALKATGNEALNLYANLFKTAPKGDFTYRDMAKALMAADTQYGKGDIAPIIKEKFTDRKILQAGDQPQAAKVRFDSVAPGADQTGGIRNVRVSLEGPQFGQFSGAIVETPVENDGSLTKDAETSTKVRNDLAKLISEGRIKYTEPNQAVSDKDYFDPQGRPYMGITRWLDGRMTIERVPVAD